VIHWMMYNKS